MATNRIGRRSYRPAHPVYISDWASIAGKKESEGPLRDWYDRCIRDTRFGAKSWEQAEQRMQHETLELLTGKAGLTRDQIDLVCSGDLLNQCIGSSFPLRNTALPHLGLYGACSTMAEALLTAALAVDAGFADRAVAMTSSHFAAAERQYRFPLGYGGQRTPTAQWTVTGCGAALVRAEPSDIRLTSATVGTVTDLGVTDSANMGAAMAPAALDTIRTHLEDLGKTSADYDLIVTGDLGTLGKQALLCLAQREGPELGGKLADCSTLVFDPTGQDVHAGGSGCGCSAVALCSVLLGKLRRGDLRRILFCGTGALLSPASVQQKLPIPGICHAVCLESGRNPWII